MRVGLCYDLRQDYLDAGFSAEQTAEFDAPETIDALEFVLRTRGEQVERIGHLQSLVNKLARGKRWDYVFSIAEGISGVAREAQIPALLEGYGIPCVFSDPTILSLTLDKAVTKRIIRDAGIPTADFRVLRNPGDLEEFSLPFPVFAKPLAEGTGKGISAHSFVEDLEGLTLQTQKLWQKYAQPVLVEHYLSGREFTVGILGQGKRSQVIGVMEVTFKESAESFGYSYENKEHYEARIQYSLADDAEAKRAGEVALQAWQALGCRDGGRVDIRSNEFGQPHFIEVNPLAGLHPERSDLVILAGMAGLSYADLIGKILDEFLTDLPNRKIPHGQPRLRPFRSRSLRFRKAS